LIIKLETIFISLNHQLLKYKKLKKLFIFLYKNNLKITMTNDILDSIILISAPVIIYTWQFGSIGLLYGFLIGLFLAWFKYKRY